MREKKSFGMYLVKTKEGKYIYVDTKLKRKPFLEKNPFYSKELATGKVHLYNDFFEGNGYLINEISCERILNSKFFKEHAEEIYKLLEEEYKLKETEKQLKLQKIIEKKSEQRRTW